MKYQIELTGSQVMALRTVLVEHIAKPFATESYLDCSVEPAVETTPAELLDVLMNVQVAGKDVRA